MATKSDAAKMADIVRGLAKKLHVTASVRTERSEAHPTGCVVVTCLAEDVVALEHAIEARASTAMAPIAFIPHARESAWATEAVMTAQEESEAQGEPEVQDVPEVSPEGLSIQRMIDLCMHPEIIKHSDRLYPYRCLTCHALLTAGQGSAVRTEHDETTAEGVLQQEKQPQDSSVQGGARHTSPSAYAISWATCFVCQAGKARSEYNGRCHECYEFFRHTGTDRSVEEIAATQGTPLPTILSNAMLRDVSACPQPLPVSIIEAELKAMLAAEPSFPTSMGSQAIYAEIDAAAEHRAAPAPLEQSAPMPGALSQQGHPDWTPQAVFLQDLVSQGLEAICAALQRGEVRVRPRAALKTARTAVVMRGKHFGEKILAEVSSDAQAQMRADRAAGMSYVAIDLKHGYLDAKATRGRVSWTVCKASTQASTTEEDAHDL